MSDPSPQEQLSLNSRIRHRSVDDQGILVHLESGRVIVVNEVGLHIVQQLSSGKTRQALTDSIVSQFDIDAKQAAADLESYLAELDKEQVLEHPHVRD